MSSLAALKELERALDALLLHLDGPPGDGEDSWRRSERACTAAFEEFRRHHESARTAGVELSAELQKKLADVQKRVAVAASLVVRRREVVVAGLQGLRDARRRLRAAAPGRPTGGSCDVRG